MPKRKRLFTPNKYKTKSLLKLEPKRPGLIEVDTARGRLMGALSDVLNPVATHETIEPPEPSPSQRDRQSSSEEYLSDDEAKKCISRSTTKQSYVLKLFDRSVDLSQFRENSPLYPICRAWIMNQPKANYKNLEPEKKGETEPGVELPSPKGGFVTKVPELLPEQQEASRDNINLNYREAPPPSMDHLLRSHLTRWTAVRQAWLDQSVRVEARYETTQKVLNRLNREYLNSRQ